MQIIPVVIPYEEDELFYSWLFRIAMHNYSINLNEFANNYLSYGKFTDTRHPRRIRYDFIENIYYFQKSLNVSEEDFLKIFHETSIFNAIAPFMNNFNKQLYYYLALGEVTENEEYILLKTLIEFTDKLQWCPKCKEEELKNKGFFWYHRSHQLPGVKVCCKHHCSLKTFAGQRSNEFEGIQNSKDSIDMIDEVDVEYSKFCKEFLYSAIDTNIYEIRKIIFRQCEELGFDQRKYKTLDEFIENSQYKKLFSQKASIFMNREEVEGTYIDPFTALPLLFVLFLDVDIVKQKVIEIHEINKVSVKTFQKELSQLIAGSRFKEPLNPKAGSSKEIMEQEMYSLVGSEYELLGEYVDRVTPVQIKHKKCQQTFFMKPIHFLDGGRCPYCKVVIKEDLFKEIVPKLSKGRYMVRGQATHNLWIIYDTFLKRDVLLTKQKVMQELNKKGQSDILPFEQKMDKEIKVMTREDVLYSWLKDRYSINDVIFLEDINIADYNYDELKHRMKRFRNSGKLEMIAPGIYNFPGANFTQNDLLINHYLIRNGKHIGFYYGKTLGYELGLCEATETLYIASNKESQRHGRKKDIYGFKIRLKGTVTEVTEDNYRLLAILDFITCYNTYTKQGKEQVLIKIKDYVKHHKIDESQVKTYIELFPIWTKNFMVEVG